MPALPEMTPANMYLMLNLGVLPFWAMLMLLPHARITEQVVHSIALPLILGVTYAWLLATALTSPAPEGAGFASLDALMKTPSDVTRKSGSATHEWELVQVQKPEDQAATP